jgi:TetR/AcrR family transcriptional regulator, upper aerobic nicotinate degradation pathway regulator
MGERAGRSEGKPSRARRSNARAKTILEVALRLFATQGYTAVSIKDIAQASRANSALIYYYFTNKEHLFVEALRHSVQAALSRRQFGARQDDPVAEIDLWFETNEKLAKPLGQMLRLMLDYRASRPRSASVRRLIGDFYATELALLKRAIDAGVKRGLFQSVDSAKTALFVSTHLDGLMFAATVHPDYDLAAGMRQLRKMLFAYLGYEGAVAGRRKGSSPTGKLRVVA